MNAAPGDIAIIVKARVRNLGKIVRVVEAFGDVDYAHAGCGVLFCWTVECLSGLADTPAGPAPGGFIPDLDLRVLLRRGDAAGVPEQLPLDLGKHPPRALARADLMTDRGPPTTTVERHPLVRLLGLERGADDVPGRSTFTARGEGKVAAACDDPRSLGVAAWCAEANRRDLAAADVAP